MIGPDPRTLRQDDRLLDRLGRGEPASGDEIERMLTAWRRDLPAAGPPDELLLTSITRTALRPRRRLARTSLRVAASVVLACGGVTLAAGYARPDSPLWPVTRLVYGTLAESRLALDDANHAVADARTAASQGRYLDAVRLLAAADRLADKIDEPQARSRLHQEIAMIRALLPTAATGSAGTTLAPKPTESLGVDAPPVSPGDDPARTPRHVPKGNGNDESGTDTGAREPAEEPDDEHDTNGDSDGDAHEGGSDNGGENQNKIRPTKDKLRTTENLTLPTVSVTPPL